MSRTAIARLEAIARKPTRRIIGLMSGTSLDGLDIALCEIAGSGPGSRLTLRQFTTVPYPDDVKAEIRKVFAQRLVDLNHLCLLNPWLANVHAGYILDALRQWNIDPAEVDLLASHGQTVYHAPRSLHRIEGAPNATLQLGDGDHLAVTTGIITISDFRQKHIAAGGEGAPLALYGDYLIFSQPGEPRLMLNMGGIANFTFLPGTPDPTGVYVTDTGPGNTLIDACARRYFQQEYDKDAGFAKQGAVHPALLQALKADDFFRLDFPKTTGPELFSLDYVERAQAASGTTGLSPYDLIATLTRFSAETIAEAIRTVWRGGPIYISGGGAHNPLLVAWIKDLLHPSTDATPGTIRPSTDPVRPSAAPAADPILTSPDTTTGIPSPSADPAVADPAVANPAVANPAIATLRIAPTDQLGIPADAKEAVLFAVLANETIAGEPIDFGRPGMPAITMGKISLP